MCCMTTLCDVQAFGLLGPTGVTLHTLHVKSWLPSAPASDSTPGQRSIVDFIPCVLTMSR